MWNKMMMMMMVKWVCIMLVLVNWASANSEGDVLIALKNNLTDPSQVLDSWDPNLLDPCTYFHVTCDSDNHVIKLDLFRSNLSGHLIPDLGNLEHLQYLELYGNNIQGSIPPELGNLENLISLDLYKNNISGIIPPELGKLKSLLFLRLNDNHLSGPIPRELANLSNLKVLNVSNNNLSGIIPTTGPFVHIPRENFKNNPGLEGPQLLGLAV
ncbi:leucine-rich repeat protein 1-like [Silene latifolia]|uniref:leucine-rich repeat protein 1-like n=1 Tax=Silene latifolia TaxID=37657 RepID=UPI003D788ECC